MKVTIEKDYRKLYTLEDVEIARKVIADEKEYDENTPAEWLKMAAGEALKDTDVFFDGVIKVEAHTAKNLRAWNKYFEGSHDMDVWIEGLVQTCGTESGFLIVGAYLSDIWETGGTDYKRHMYIRYFGETVL